MHSREPPLVDAKKSASVIAQIGAAYDAMPYHSAAFSFSHPNRLAALAFLHGIECARPSRCRVLEIGCASGGNLLPMALGMPECEFVGIDLSSVQVAQARQAAATLGIKNVRLIDADVRSLPPDAGEFDYIICHGVYSWVPANVRKTILDICDRHLTPTGVAMVSFNVYPGWHQFDRLRRLLSAAVATASAANPQAAVAAALAWIQRLPRERASEHAKLRIERTMRTMIEQFESGPPEYLYHEFFNEINAPEYVDHFLRAARSHQLNYVCDADWFLNAQFAALSERAGLAELAESRATREALLDDLANTQFRRALLCRAEQRISERPDLSRMDALHVACRFSPVVEPMPDGVQSTSALALRLQGYAVESRGERTQLLFPAAIAAVQQIQASSPRYVSVGHLIADACKSGPESNDAKQVRHALVTLAGAGGLDVAAEPFPISSSPPEPDALWPWAAYQFNRGELRLTGRTHASVELDAEVFSALEPDARAARLNSLLSARAEGESAIVYGANFTKETAAAEANVATTVQPHENAARTLALKLRTIGALNEVRGNSA